MIARAIRALRRLIGWSVASAAGVAAALLLWSLMRARPQDLPWTPLDLGEPVGAFTGRKLAALGEDFPQCRHLLAQAGVRFETLAPVESGQCGYRDAVRFAAGGSRRMAFSPPGVGVACPVAAALGLWEWDVVQPAAQRRFGSPVVTVQHFGSYNCRRIRGNASNWSEHAHANALDVAGFTLADGTRITVARDWRGADTKSRFLHDVRDGACRLFATVLSPDYNAAHADHFHLDQANRGALGWRACR